MEAEVGVRNFARRVGKIEYSKDFEIKIFGDCEKYEKIEKSERFEGLSIGAAENDFGGVLKHAGHPKASRCAISSSAIAKDKSDLNGRMKNYETEYFR